MARMAISKGPESPNIWSSAQGPWTVLRIGGWPSNISGHDHVEQIELGMI